MLEWARAAWGGGGGWRSHGLAAPLPSWWCGRRWLPAAGLALLAHGCGAARLRMRPDWGTEAGGGCQLQGSSRQEWCFVLWLLLSRDLVFLGKWSE